jgi:hypothetical protein
MKAITVTAIAWFGLGRLCEAATLSLKCVPISQTPISIAGLYDKAPVSRDQYALDVAGAGFSVRAAPAPQAWSIDVDQRTITPVGAALGVAFSAATISPQRVTATTQTPSGNVLGFDYDRISGSLQLTFLERDNSGLKWKEAHGGEWPKVQSWQSKCTLINI